MRRPRICGRLEWKNATSGMLRACATAAAHHAGWNASPTSMRSGSRLREHVGPLARRERQPVVERAGHGPAGEGADAARLQASTRAGHQQRMPMRGVRAQPVVLGGQVAAHAATGRREEDRGVDQVHAIPCCCGVHCTGFRSGVSSARLLARTSSLARRGRSAHSRRWPPRSLDTRMRAPRLFSCVSTRRSAAAATFASRWRW